MTTALIRPETSKVLCLLAAGHTIEATATTMQWPAGTIRALANGQRGWLIDETGRVYNPGRPGAKVQLPDGVDLAHLEWANHLLETPRPARKTAARPSPARPTVPALPAPTGRAAIGGPIVVEIPLDKIHPHPSNVREDLGDLSELTASIRAHGLLQPITVRPHPTLVGEYEALAGHRRHPAARAAGLAAAPCIITHAVVEPGQVIEVMLVENVQRRNLNPMEKAEALGKLRDVHGYSAALISARTGINSSTVSTLLALLDLDTSSRQRVRDGEITATEAIAAVREMRKKRRGAKSATEVSQWSWEPDYLAKTHPLARKAERLCDARDHGARRRIGKVACGQCWETVIRADERVVVAAESEAP